MVPALEEHSSGLVYDGRKWQCPGVKHKDSSLGVPREQRGGSPNHTQAGWSISQGFPGKDNNRQCLLDTFYVLGMRVSILHGLIILLYHHCPSGEIQWDFLRRNPSSLGGAWLWEADRLGGASQISLFLLRDQPLGTNLWALVSLSVKWSHWDQFGSAIMNTWKRIIYVKHLAEYPLDDDQSSFLFLKRLFRRATLTLINLED